MTTNYTLIQGDSLEILPTLETESVHCVVTSPPYWGLRDYGTATWAGGDVECDHKIPLATKGGCAVGNKQSSNPGSYGYREWLICGRCGARRVDSQIGLEETPEAYVEKLVQVFRQVWRVLRDDGTVWLNLGDSYAGISMSGGGKESSTLAGTHHEEREGARFSGVKRNTPDLKPKDLVGIPWRVALALQADGWYLRSDIIWHKPNPMPESVTDRPTKSHEYIFLLSKSERYYYDADAVAEKAIGGTDLGLLRGKNVGGLTANTVSWHAITIKNRQDAGIDSRTANVSGTRNKRSVWTVPTHPYSGAHFATFPPKLIEPCILAGCPAGGVVLDPFNGAGTTGVVALQHGRRYVGIELNPEYLEMARQRIDELSTTKPAHITGSVADTDDLPLFYLSPLEAGEGY